MLNSNEWQQSHGDFLTDSQHLLNRADECLNHLELISDDTDAIECLLVTLQQIAGKADTAGLSSVGRFARQLRAPLSLANTVGCLLPKAQASLRQCLWLLSWQVELVDPRTGLLPLDDVEQQELLEALGCCFGTSQQGRDQAMPLTRPASPTSSPM